MPQEITLPYTHVSHMEFISREKMPALFMAGHLLTVPSAAVLVMNGILKPELLIPVKSEHYFGSRIYGVTHNVFKTNHAIYDFIEHNKQFKRLSKNLSCEEIISPGIIEEILELAK